MARQHNGKQMKKSKNGRKGEKAALAKRPRGKAIKTHPGSAAGGQRLVGGAQSRIVRALTEDEVVSMLNGEVTAAITSRPIENKQDLHCLINPQLLFQYIYAVFMRPIANSDNLKQYQTSLSAAVSVFVNFENLFQVYAGVSLPLHICRLRRYLEPKRNGRIEYSSDFRAVNQVAASVQASGILATNIGFVLPYPTGAYDASGFGVTTTVTPTITPTVLSEHVANFAAVYRPAQYEQVSVSPADCSAYAFDIGGAVAQNDINSSSGNAMAATAGFQQNSSIQLYIKQAGSWGLEVKPGNLDIARCRFATQAWKAIANDNTSGYVRASRLGVHTGVCGTLPSVVAFSTVGSQKLRGPVSLKPLSLVSACTALLEKIEALVTNGANAPLQTPIATSWLSTFSTNQIKMLIAGWARYQFRVYSGAYAGTVLVSQGAAVAPMYPECHQGYEMFGLSPIPEYVNMALKCLTPYMDRSITIIPWSPQVNPNIISPGLIYTGSSTPTIATIPTTDDAAGRVNFSLQLGALYMSQVPNVTSYTKSDNLERERMSLLDTTVVLGQSTENVVSIRSRRQLTPQFLNYCLRNVRFMTYDYTTEGPGQIFDPNDANQEYGQTCRKDLSGLDAPFSIQTLNKLDGVVSNGFASNYTAATGDDNDNSSLQAQFSPPSLEDRGPRSDLTREPPNDNASLVSKFFSALMPRKGNYCGPGWTAGVDTFQSETFVTPEGKYITAPVDEEDAICKRHDEAYRSSKGDKELVNAADWQMVKELEALRLTKGLSRYSHASQEAIRLKAQIMF